MKKTITIIFVACTLIFAACGPSAEEKAKIEKAKQDSIADVKVAKERILADSTAKYNDDMKSKMVADSTKKYEADHSKKTKKKSGKHSHKKENFLINSIK